MVSYDYGVRHLDDPTDQRPKTTALLEPLADAVGRHVLAGRALEAVRAGDTLVVPSSTGWPDRFPTHVKSPTSSWPARSSWLSV